MSKKLPFVLKMSPNETPVQAKSAAALNPAINALAVVDAYQPDVIGDDLDPNALADILKANIAQSAAGDLTGLESMLIGQATALQTVFVSLARRARNQEYQKQFEGYLGLALKAQAQSRATIQAVIDLKYPRQVQYVQQANFAHTQQVNNGMAQRPPRTRKKLQDAKNKLLEQTDHDQCMDTGTQKAAERSNPQMAAVGTVDRTQNARRQDDGGTERL